MVIERMAGDAGQPRSQARSAGWKAGQCAVPVRQVGSSLSVTLGSQVRSQICGWPAV